MSVSDDCVQMYSFTFSSRPALSSLEKKWIVYQLLQSLKDSHQQKSDGKPVSGSIYQLFYLSIPVSISQYIS